MKTKNSLVFLVAIFLEKIFPALKRENRNLDIRYTWARPRLSLVGHCYARATRTRSIGLSAGFAFTLGSFSTSPYGRVRRALNLDSKCDRSR